MLITKTMFMIVAILILVSAGCIIRQQPSSEQNQIPSSNASINSRLNDMQEKINCEKTGTVTKVIDGDTIWIENEEKVRLVGVNTPELRQRGYDEAKNYTIVMVKNKQVCLDIDNAKPKDRFGRTLAIVYINGTNLNRELLRNRYAKVMYMPPSEFYPYDWIEN